MPMGFTIMAYRQRDSEREKLAAFVLEHVVGVRILNDCTRFKMAELERM